MIFLLFLSLSVILLVLFHNGAIAQWLEQRTHNPPVAGSSPACPILFKLLW